MRICLLSTVYPPTTTEGIARQRATLARALAALGHDVHVVTCGEFDRTWRDGDVTVFEVAVPQGAHFLQAHPALDGPLAQSQALAEGLERSQAQRPSDIVDIPFWQAQAFAPLARRIAPSVIWLQTTTAQLLALHGLSIRDHRPLLEIERQCLERADGWLADSQSILDTLIQDYHPSRKALTGIAYLGLPPLPPLLPIEHAGVEALVVGRLEQRKGTPLLFDVLPAVLRALPQLRVRFLGRDNSAHDGWRQRMGATYPDYFARKHPGLVDRVIFEGYVDEQRLAEAYQHADMLLAPSLYESFGLIYLEGMRAGLPVIAQDVGAAREIFANGLDDGAILTAPGERRSLAAALTRLVSNASLRQEVGECGRTRFLQYFTDQAMAEATVAFYQQVLDAQVPRRAARTIYQVMEALDTGDAVSNITRHNARLLSDLGQPREILARYHRPELAREVLPIHRALSTPDCGIIFHYWGYNSSAWLLHAMRGPVALHYHNITPPYFAPADSPQREAMERGYAQLAEIADLPDLVIGDSQFNIDEFMQFRSRPCPTLPIYPVVEPQIERAIPYDRRLFDHLKHSGEINLLFVGRVARNKRQDRLMAMFDYYWRFVNRRSQLWLVGNDRSDPEYRAELEQLREQLPSGANIHFTGKVSDAEMYTYFRAADVFVCASEHEGFCVPIAQAMAFDIPVIAYAAAAVPETLGGAGFLVQQWDVQRVGELATILLTNDELRQSIVSHQRLSMKRFSDCETRSRLASVIAYLQTGEEISQFTIQDELKTYHITHAE